MAKRNKVFWQVKVTFCNGERLIITCADEWTARETCNRANLLPGVKVAEWESHGYTLFTSWESAMASVASMTPERSSASDAYLSGKNPLG